MTNTEKFIEKYKELEQVTKSAFNLDNSDSVSYYLTHETGYRRYKDEIRYMSDIRNLLSHNIKINGAYCLDVNDNLLQFIDDLISDISKRKKCIDIATLAGNIYFADTQSSVKDVLNYISDKIFNHVPVLNGNKLLGVFDENSLFEMIKDGIAIDSKLKFKDILKYIDIDNRKREVFVFVKNDMYVDELLNIFNSYYEQGKRVGLVFLSNKGNRDDKICGIISNGDLLGK